MATLIGLALSGCSRDRDDRFAAHFIEHTDWNVDGEPWRETIRGAFDWDAKKGWATEKLPSLAVLRTIQIGDRCFERSGTRPWKQTHASGADRLCSEVFQCPRSASALLRKVTSLKVVGKETLRSTQTTHYRGYLHVGAVEGSVEVWVDESGAIRRERFEPPDKGFVSTTVYYDFGAEVDVAPPRGIKRK
jgi:hypothetical protein